jgi:hypothetical protein
MGLSPTIRGQPNPSYILKDAGIKATSIEEYVIIADQLMLAIDKTRISSENVDVNKAFKKNPKGIKAVDGARIYAQDVLDILNERDGNTRKLVLVNDTPVTNPKKSSIVLFWVMPAAQLNHLLRKGFPKLLGWALPYRAN